MGATARWFKALIGIKKTKISDAEQDTLRSSINTKSKRWLVWRLGSSKSKKEQQEKSQSMRVCESTRFLQSEDFEHSRRHLEGLKMQWAATRIQCAFRRLLARRALKALRAIVRIQAIIRGRLVRRRVSESRHIVIEAQPCEPKRREWCDHQGSAQEIEARRQHRYNAAVRRDRAMSYAVLHQAAKRAEFWQTWQKEQPEQEKLDGHKLRVMPEIAISYYYSGPIFPILATSTSPSVVSCAHEHRNVMYAHYHGSGEKDDERGRGGVSPGMMRPGYMEATISMKAKCKSNLGNASKWQQNTCNHPRLRQRHTCIAGLDTHNLLLQCR